jgi:lipopolysaccharide cholinephosphotransferase
MVDEDIALRKLQLLELKILLEFKRICEKHHIQYFLAWGTLLGAVRHQGFIPWDDDIDVGMLRSEYIKFLAVCNDELSQEYFLQTFESERTYANSFAKLRLNGTEHPGIKNKDMLQHKGISIDIFPFDHIPDNYFLRNLHIFKLTALTHVCGIKYDYITKPSSLKGKLLYFGLQCLSKVFSKNQVIKMREYLFQKYNKKCTDYYIDSSLCCCFPSEIFDQFSELEFEGIKFQVPAGYTTYLECAYGDYMRLPPEHERVRHSPYPPDFGKYANINSVNDVLMSITTSHRTGDTICKQ